MKRLFAAVATGSVLFAGAFGFAQVQAFSGGGVAAQGSATAQSCAASLSVLYIQTAGVVTGLEVKQDPAGNCDGAAVHVSVQNLGGTPLGVGDGTVNGGPFTVTPSISSVSTIDHAVVTITDGP